MGLLSNLHEAQRNATGAAASAIASLISLPHATLAGLAGSIRGKSFTEASTAIMEKYAEIGLQIGREKSDQILAELIKAHQKR